MIFFSLDFRTSFSLRLTLGHAIRVFEGRQRVPCWLRRIVPRTRHILLHGSRLSSRYLTLHHHVVEWLHDALGPSLSFQLQTDVCTKVSLAPNPTMQAPGSMGAASVWQLPAIAFLNITCIGL